MKYYWCNRCNKQVAKNDREMRPSGRGWTCPTCEIGLPRHPIEIIHEQPDLEELLG